MSPDGGTVAYVVTRPDRDKDENTSTLWSVVPGEEPRRLTHGRRDRCPRWSPDGHWLAFLRAGSGAGAKEDDDAGAPQIWLLPLAGGEPRRLTDCKLGAGEPIWSPDSTRIAFAAASGEVDPNAPVVTDTLDFKADGAGLLRGLRKHVFVVTIDEDSTAVQVTEGDFHAGTPRWSPDGTRLAFATSRESDRDLVISGAAYIVEAGKAPAEPQRVSDCSGSGRGARRAEPERSDEGTVVVSEVVDWLADDRLLLAGLAGPALAHTRLYTVPAAGGSPTEIETGLDRNVMVGGPGYPGAAPQLAGDTLIFCARDRGCTHAYSVPFSNDTRPARKIIGAADTGRQPAQRSGAGGQAAGIPEHTVISGLSVAAGRIAYVAVTPHSTGDLHVSDVDGGNPTRLTDLALPEVELYAAVEREFTAPDGTVVHGFVLRDPAADQPGPLLLDAHGGPHNAWSPAFDGAHLYHQVLAAAGWTILTLNVRGSDGYGESFYTAVTGDWGTADLHDFLTPVQALVDEGVADPARLALTGYSYGGYISCWLPTQTDRFAAVVSGGCVSDPVSFAGTSDAGHLLAAYEYGELPQKDPARYAARSPMAHVNKVRAPTLLLHGEDDVRCPVGQAEQWFTALREAGVPTRLVRYPGASHLFILEGRPSHRLDFNRRIQEWVTQWT